MAEAAEERLGKETFRRVEKWLYSIPKLRIAVSELRVKLETLETRAASPPVPVSDPDRPPLSGSKEDRLARWTTWLEDEYPTRKAAILHEIAWREERLKYYDRIMDELRKESVAYTRLARMKYEEQLRDEQIQKRLGLSARQFYRMRRHIVYTVYECLPGEFLKVEKEKVTGREC